MKERKPQGPSVYDVVQNETTGQFQIMRNGRHLMTPAGNAYTIPTLKMAEEIAAEWKAQGEKIIPATLPLTQLYATAVDIIAKDRGKTACGLLAYIGSSLRILS